MTKQKTFQNPSKDIQAELLARLKRSDGLFVGDAFLRFILSDKGLSRGRLDGSHLNPLETRVFQRLRTATEQLQGEDETSLINDWLLTTTERQVIVSLLTSFVDHDGKGKPASPLRQHVRIKQALAQVINLGDVNLPLRITAITLLVFFCKFA